MSCNRLCPPLGPVYTDPTVVYTDVYVPQPVQVVHPVEFVKRYHCVPVPFHVVQYTSREEFPGATATISSLKKKKK